MTAHVLALDQGTTGNTVLVIDPEGGVVGRASNEFPQHFPEPGLVEHDPLQIWDSLRLTIGQALAAANLRGGDIGAIGITNQRETTVLWERGSGRPVANAIVWQDRRTAARCNELKAQGKEATLKQKTGLVADAYFSATKLEWLLDRHDANRRRAAQGELCFGTIDAYLLYRLTSGNVHATEPSNASRTLLMNIHTCAWDDELTSLFRVPVEVLPKIMPSAGVFGETRGLDILPDGIPIAGIAGDQQAALFGQACFTPGQSKCTYGTGAFLLLNTGETPAASRYGVLTTVAWQLQNAKPEYALEGSSFVAGSAVQWLRDGLKIIKKSSHVERLAKQVGTSDGVTFVPALTGLGAPHWRPEARGTIHGITRGTTAAHIARATLEGIALQIVELIDAMNADAPVALQELRVDGGAAANNTLMQMQADLGQIRIVRPKNIETTAWGAGFLAGLGAGIWRDRGEITQNWQKQKVFRPNIGADEAAARLAAWRKVVAKA